MVFPCEENEAWDIVNNRSEWKRHDFILLGTSDGTTFNRMIKENRQKVDALSPVVDSLEAEVAQFVRMREKLMLDEIVDMDDLTDPVNAANVAKIKRLDEILRKKRVELLEKKTEYKRLAGDMVKIAIDAERLVAEANLKAKGAEWPGPINIITPSASAQERERILRNMPR
jgi:hypothetical protein